MDLALPTTAATAERELTVLPSSGLTTIRDLQRKTNQSPDPMEEFFVEDASNPESLEHFCFKKSKPSKEPNKHLENDLALFKQFINTTNIKK